MPQPDTRLPDDVRDALEQGQTLAAIKLLRERQGITLQQAKMAIDSHQRGRTGAAAGPGATDGALPADVIQAMREGRKIEAIRLLREQTGLGLKAAKEAVESVAVEPRSSTGLQARVEASRQGTVIWTLLLVALGLLAYYLWGPAP